jgi:LmbE family N-acetylglucosaminyl deacetylase
MASICPFASLPPAAGFLAGMQYQSGRRIYAGERPEAAEWVSHPDHAQRHPNQETAKHAALALCRAFEIKNRDAITLFTVRAFNAAEAELSHVS